ncbi:N-acetylmuramoyl-L-alanine amidase [Candidatus Galacturonibacter soehngenii]|uniref:N-acetylmuramoyl-L-alanine amidase n=1 Tax=Candidatus Galacturonatibacter soehngenii TaxID=2307010 RepID=A0A7V7QI98_9FIRM|nr:N-acetylmuramoyl-L-alanine amidase [Candidatus Galacturonibacter soehngenii]KAB1435830.1 N-acetylmuramoyl-L-alanine amidase [Candidatus Galacturonibacter soehngenii]MBA4686572.1 N-acetylmuramoyl-L-alanine amidase [Candidatus Galacturonibacter soehngenii]
MKRKTIEILMTVILLMSALVIGQQGSVAVTNMKSAKQKPVVVIDAGHGGNDPGKVGINNALEKDINLSIAILLKKMLEAEDIEVIMTRETDKGLYDENAKNKKVQDMKRRCEIIGKANSVVTISIHQNSYHEEYVNGAQVFYFQHSDNAKKLAEIIQTQLQTHVQPNNKRSAKNNASYYLLKKTDATAVIVECGFLSNYEEASKLVDENYQQKLAWAIHLGILQYINGL